ncbi:MAG: hypothetical protein GY950_34600 [bacterium]|nr:hypothetical protein [bacterium]
MTSKKRNSIHVEILSFVLIALLGIPFFAQDSQETLNYNVSVNVMVVPIFAVDNNGNPVYDLKQEELKLFINDKPLDIVSFRRYEFGHRETVAEKSGKQAPNVGTAEGRFVFIILDTMFNTLTGFRRGKEIAVNLVKEGSPGDNFVILENNPIGGLKYIGGTARDGDQLIKKIKKLVAPPDKWTPDMYSSRLLNNNITSSPMTDPRLESSNWKTLRELNVNSEKQRYQHQVRYFSRVLSQFKYALKTIDKPKIVFIVSEGVARGAFRAAIGSQTVSAGGSNDGREGPGKGFDSILTKDESTVFDRNKIYSSFMLKYLVEVVKSINNGGSVLYTINPRRTNDINDREASGEMSLRYLAGESGGKYFAGSKPAKIVQRVKKTTAAYYELFYNILPGMGSDMTVRIECTRKNVRVHSLNHTERNRPYHRMPAVQKKLFAFNVITKGNWSRIVGKVMKVKYKKVNSKKEKLLTLRVPLPKVMQNRKVDMFSIRVDPKTQKTVVDVVSSNVKDVVNLKIKPRKDKNQYFVIIEPTTPHCIYNKI